MNRARLVIGLLLAGTALTPVAAQAQAANQRRVDITLSAGAEHDTNIARVSPALAAARNIKPEDTVYSPNLSLDIYVPVGRQTVFLTGDVGYHVHDINTRLDRENINVSGGGIARISRCQVTLSGDYRRALSELAEVELADTVTNTRTTQAVNLGAQCSPAVGLGVIASASQSWTDNTASRLIATDSRRTSGSLGVSYGRPALGTVTVFGSYSTAEFPKRLTPTGGTDGYELTSFGVSYKRQLGARISGDVSVSYTDVKSKIPPQGAQSTEFKGATYQGVLTYRVTSRLSTQADFQKGVSPSTGVNRSYDLRTTYGASARYQFGSRLSAGIEGRYSELDANGALLPSAVTLTHSETSTYGADIRYAISRRIALRLEGQHQKRTASLSSYNYSSDQIGLTASVKF